MPDLSSAAQAVLSGFRAVPNLMDRPSIAGALRALADQVAPETPHSDPGDPEMLKGIWDERRTIRAEILNIADDLDGVKYGTYRCDLSSKNND